MVPPEVKEARKVLASYGGKVRADAMTAKERSESAQKASKARWAKHKKDLSTDVGANE